MNNVRQKRKLQMMEYPKVSTIKQYDNFRNSTVITVPQERRKKVVKRKTKAIPKIKIKGVNRMKVAEIIILAIIFLFAFMVKMWVIYEVSNLGNKKLEAERKLNEIKLEVETLESTYISNFDLKQVEQKSKELGFVRIDNIEYIKLK